MKKALWLILFFYFLQGLTHNLGHAVTPVYVDQLGIPRYMFGFFFSAMSLGLLIGGPIWGVAGDRGRQKPLIVIGLLLYSVGQIMFVMTSNLILMTFFRFFSGFFVSAAVTLLLAQIVNLASVQERTKYLSLSAAALALGTTFGYKIGGYLGTFIIREVFFVQGFLNAIYALLIFLVMREAPRKTSTRPESFFESMKTATKMDKSLLLFLLALTLATMAAINLTKYLDVYFILELNYSTNQLGTFVFITGLVGIFTNFVIVPFIARFNKDFAFMKYIQILSAIIVFFVFRSQAIIIALYTGYMVYVVLKSIYQPLEQNFISSNAKDSQYGSILGVRQAFFALGMIIGPLVSGFLYDANPIWVFDFSALLFVVAFVLLIVSENALSNTSNSTSKPIVRPLETAEYKASP